MIKSLLRRATGAAFLVVMQSMSSHAVEIIGHRGASADAPENTCASFKAAYEQHADAVELDVHFTKDGRIVVSHDADTGRTTGVTNNIADLPFAEIRRLEAGNWGPWRGKGFSERMPSLEEALALVPAGKRLFIEIKCGPEILPELERALRRATRPGTQTVLIGFGYDTMRQAKAKFPALTVLGLFSKDNQTKVYPPLDELIQKAKAAGFDGLDLEAGFPIDKDFVRKVHQAGLKLYTWTVDDPAVARREVEAGVDGITTNRPGRLRTELATVP